MVQILLLVEPCPDLRDVLPQLAQDAGWTFHVAVTAFEMPLAIALTNYDCVFLNLDQGRPKNFGLELADYAAARGTRIMMISDQRFRRGDRRREGLAAPPQAVQGARDAGRASAGAWIVWRGGCRPAARQRPQGRQGLART